MLVLPGRAFVNSVIKSFPLLAVPLLFIAIDRSYGSPLSLHKERTIIVIAISIIVFMIRMITVIMAMMMEQAITMMVTMYWSWQWWLRWWWRCIDDDNDSYDDGDDVLMMTMMFTMMVMLKEIGIIEIVSSSLVYIWEVNCLLSFETIYICCYLLSSRLDIYCVLLLLYVTIVEVDWHILVKIFYHPQPPCTHISCSILVCSDSKLWPALSFLRSRWIHTLQSQLYEWFCVVDLSGNDVAISR